MDHLTNLYKHKCEQLQEHINNLTRMLNEADANSVPPYPVAPWIIFDPPNDPGYPLPRQTPDGYWYSPKPTGLPNNLPRVPDEEEEEEFPFPVWFHDSTPPDWWDGWWPDAPDGDPRQQQPTEWPRHIPDVLG